MLKRLKNWLLDLLLDHPNHDHILKYAEFKIGDKVEYGKNPVKFLNWEYGHGVVGVWYQECMLNK